MTTEEFMQLWADTDLRQHIVDEAKRHSRRIELQEEFVQEAWLCISCAPFGRDLDSYKHISYKAIYSSYWQHHKEQLLMQTVDKHDKSISAKTPEQMTDNDKLFMAKEEQLRKDRRD